ncbi:tetratricopeptide repeat protein [Streptomyces sp. B6B3]|uniref:AfsR/SARP family transcriptional regulator n=1 Tax=Streptomyces sp. B6B3 TaxID=3153570 RepID=UPI00325EDF62
MEILVLGALEIRRDGEIEAVSGPLRQVLLGVLLARANQAVSVDVLTDALWGDQPDERAVQRLHLHVHRLRSVLGDGDRLSFDQNGYRLRLLPGELDAERFETLVTEGERLADEDPERAAEVLRRALRLWRTTRAPLAEVDVPLVADWSNRLTERRLAAYETLYRAELACGPSADVVGELAELVRDHPLRERLHGLLMVALYRSGRRDEALAAYRVARRRLVEELGLEPGPELREVERRILGGEPVEVGGERRPEAALPAQLPGDVAGFVGREGELAELDGLLSVSGAGTGPVVVTAVTGTAGVGKTALVVRWAHRVRERFPDGQFYVDLRGYGPDRPVTPEDALGAFLRALGLEGAAMPQDLAERAARFRTLVDGRRMLVVLDNAHSVEQVRPLLPGSPTCFALVTSRDALAGLVARDGARRIVLDRLTPGEARRLLHELLGERVAGEPEARDALIERCARLPLALRIAAERIRAQPGRGVADLVGELADQQEALDALDVEGDPHTAVRAVFSWSYQRLDPAVARVFRLLGVHPGHDTDAYAVAALADDGLRQTRRALQVLLRAHLVDQVSGGRYQAHDLLRAYAADLAAHTDSADGRAAALVRLRGYYLFTASIAMDRIATHEYPRRPRVPAWPGEAPPFTGYEQAWRWLGAEWANLLEVTVEGEPTFVVLLSETLWRFVKIGGYYDEAITLYARALRGALTVGDALAEANARRVLGGLMSGVGDDAPATDHLERALAIYEQVGEPLLQAAALNNLGVLCTRKGDLSASTRHLEKALAMGRLGGWQFHCAIMVNLSENLRALGRYEEAIGHLEGAFVLFRDNGDRPNVSYALGYLSELYLFTGRDEEALEHANRALALSRETGFRVIEAVCLRVLGALRQKAGDDREALSLHDQALELTRAVGDTKKIATALNALARTHTGAGHPAEALRLYGESLTVAEKGHGEEQGHAHAGIAEVHAGLGEHDRARDHWRRALEHYEALGLPHAARTRARLESPER